MKCLILILSLALARIAGANIGETEAQVEERYGKPFNDINTTTFGPVRGFVSPQYIIGVKIIDGLSEMEMFARTDQSDISASEITRLLKADAGGEWKAEPTGKPSWRRWRRDDQGAVGLYDAQRHFLYISTIKFFDDEAHRIEAATSTPEPQ